MARQDASELAIRLGRQAEAVCRHYLSAGHREGRYWLVGDVRNTPGRSMFVRLKGGETGKGAAGKWTDAATGEHGDLLDLIRESCGLVDFKDVADEARTFLSMPHPEPDRPHSGERKSPAPTGSPEASRRLFAMAQPISGTLVKTYLRTRGITDLHGTESLRFHPRCYYRPDEHSPTETWPAMVASVTDLAGHQTGAHRTWLAPNGSGMAERVLGNVISSGIKVLVLAVIIGIGSTLFSEFTSGFGGQNPTIDEAMAIVLAALSLLGLGIFGPGIASGIVSGGPQLSAGAAVGTGLAAGGMVALGAGAVGAAASGGASLAGGAAAAARGGAAVAGGASTAYSIGAAGQSGMAGVASGLGGVASAGGSAAVSPLRRAASRAAESMKSSFNAGSRAVSEAAGGSSGSTSNDTLGDGAGSSPGGGPPAWAQRMRRSQTMTHAAQATAHAVRSGDAHGGGSSVNLSEGDR